jgi:hypothetical protein
MAGNRNASSTDANANLIACFVPTIQSSAR